VARNLFSLPLLIGGPGSSVCIATGYGLDGRGIESRWGVRFSAPVQTGPGAHPASWTMGTGTFPGVEIGRGVTLTPHPLLVPLSCKGRVILLLPLWAVRLVRSLSACTRMHFTFTFTLAYHIRHKPKSNIKKFIRIGTVLLQLRNPSLWMKYQFTFVRSLTSRGHIFSSLRPPAPHWALYTQPRYILTRWTSNIIHLQE
jgi:hypothetical protein